MTTCLTIRLTTGRQDAGLDPSGALVHGGGAAVRHSRRPRLHRISLPRAPTGKAESGSNISKAPVKYRSKRVSLPRAPTGKAEHRKSGPTRVQIFRKHRSKKVKAPVNPRSLPSHVRTHARTQARAHTQEQQTITGCERAGQVHSEESDGDSGRRGPLPHPGNFLFIIYS